MSTTSTPARNQQGITRYEPYVSNHPVLAVRSASTAVNRSISQGRATTTTPNLQPAGQQVSAVGSITATDGTVWTVPAATQFTSGTKAGDLYNETTGMTPANFTASATLSGNTVTLKWPAQPGISYVVQWSGDLIHWNSITVGQTGTWTDPNTPPIAVKRF